MADVLTTWLTQHTGFVIALGVLAFLLLAASLLATPWFLSRLPPDYFSTVPASGPRSLRSIGVSIIRTVAGFALILLAVPMMLTPGPGLILLIFGLALCEFPGKHKLVIKLVRLPIVLSALNWMRLKTNKPPFIVPPAG